MTIEGGHIESCFFIAPVYKEGVVLGAPKVALEYSDKLKEKYVLNSPVGTDSTISVNLRPRYKDDHQGWLVEAVNIKKPKRLVTKYFLQTYSFSSNHFLN